MMRWLWTFRLVDFWKSNVSIRSRNVLTHRAENIERHLGSPHNTSTKRFPIFSLRKRIYPSATVSPRSAPRWERAVRVVVVTPNNFPWSYFHNKKHQIGFPLTRASICRLRAPPSPSVFLSVHSFPFIHSRVIRFLLAEPAVRLPFNLSPPLEPYRLYYVFASSFVHHVRAGVVFCPANEICLWRVTMKRSNVHECRSRNHFIVLQGWWHTEQEFPIAAYVAIRRSHCVRNGSRRRICYQKKRKEKLG